MEFAPPYVDLGKLKRKMDIRNLIFQIDGKNVYKEGRFYMLWKDGNFIVIQAEPWWRPDCDLDIFLPEEHYLEERRAFWYIHEVIQTMLESIVFDGENTWAYLVRLPKDKSYRLVYKKRQLVPNCPIWTKVVELDDIEVTRFESGLCWEGIYEGEDVDLFIGWKDDWGKYVSCESRGQKLIESTGLGCYFFELKAHISKNGNIIGVMMEPLVGRRVTPADRSPVFEAIADILGHGVIFYFQICDIFITERGVRFSSASSAKYYRDRDSPEFADEADYTWETLTMMFDHMNKDPLKVLLTNSRSKPSNTFIIPRLFSPDRLMDLTREEAIIRWFWSVRKSDGFCRVHCQLFAKLYQLCGCSENLATRRGKRTQDDTRILLPSDDSSDDEATVTRIGSMDRPLVANGRLVARLHPYARPAPRRLLLPRESD